VDLKQTVLARVRVGARTTGAVALLAALCVMSVSLLAACPSRAQARPTARVTLSASPARTHTGRLIHLRGTVPSNHVADKVTIMRQAGPGQWRVWKIVGVRSSAYSVSWLAPSSSGPYLFRTVYKADGRYRTSYSPVRTITVVPEPNLLVRRDLLYGAEIECAQVDGRPAVDPATRIPREIIAAGIPVVRFSVYDVFTDMTDPNGDPGTIRRSDFDRAIRGIVNTLHAVPFFTLLPVIDAEKIDTKPGTVFVPPLDNLGRDLAIHEAILKEISTVYKGPIIIESDNEGEYDSYKKWGFADAGSAGVSRALGDKFALTMPALKKYARDVLGFSQVVTVGYVGVAGGPGWGQAVRRDPGKPYGYACEYRARSIDEFNAAVHNAYVAHGDDPYYIPDVESVHSYAHDPDFSDKAGYEFNDNMVYAYFRNWLVQSRRHLDATWGSSIGGNIRFSISEWNAGANNTDGTWSGWKTPRRVQSFYKGWLRMLQGNGTTTGAGTRYWSANCFELASESPTGYGRFYNLIRENGSTPAWYKTFKAISTGDPRR
jgi:hypothetical protein